MAGVVFVLEFLEFFLLFPHEDLGFGEDAGLEIGVDDAALPCGVVAPRDLRPFSREAAICF